MIRFVPFVLLLAAASTFGMSCQIDPLTGKSTLNVYSFEQEKRMGDEAAPPIVAQLGGLYPDDATQRYVNDVGQKVVTAARTRLREEANFPDWDFQFYVVNDSMINAFALPGGHVFVTRGIMLGLEDEAELAGLLGHEVAHVFARHSAERMTETALMNIPVAMLASVEETQGVAAVGMVAVQILGLSYSRSDESESDTFGMRFAARAGYHPAGVIGVMQMLDDHSAERGGSPPEFLSTHPDPGNRVAALTRQLNNEYANADANGNYVRNPGAYVGACADMRAAQPAYELADRGDAAMAAGFEAFENGDSALASRKYGDALRLYEQATNRVNDHAILHVNAAQARYYLEDYDAAETSIRRALRLEGGSFWPNFMGGMVAIQREDNTAAQQRLTRALAIVPESPVGNFYTAVAWDRENNTAQASEYYGRTWDILGGQGELAERARSRLIELGQPDPAGE